jgi:predicted dithiol-disulfide oxidoreductase (DUF899 family)
MTEARLPPAAEIAAANPARLPNESEAYRRARNALLAEEIELRRHVERVAALRRALPPGGPVTKDYRFVGEAGPVGLADLFGRHETLVIYSYMFGPERARPCPMCVSMVSGWEGKVAAITERVALALTARSPIERLVTEKARLGWRDLPVYSDLEGAYTRDYVDPQDGDSPGFSVFTRRDGTIRHFWSDEMFGASADPSQDPRGAPDPDPLWSLLDKTPEGRGADWYPKLPEFRAAVPA